MSDLFSVAADFYANFPNKQPLFDGRGDLLVRTKFIVQNSICLPTSQKDNLVKVLDFMSSDGLTSIGESLLRQNIRVLINKAL